MRIGTAAAVVALSAGALSGVVTASPADAAAAAAVKCVPSVNVARPADYTDVKVHVATGADAKVTTVAHYRTTSTTKHTTAGPRGNADVTYYISGATPGYKVKVTVTVSKAGRTGNCSTSFTPKR